MVRRTLSNETVSPATGVVFALVLHILTPVSRERVRTAAREGGPTDEAVPTMCTGVGQAWVILFVVPVRVVRIGSGTAGVLFLVIILLAVLILVRSPIYRHGNRTEETLIVRLTEATILFH